MVSTGLINGYVWHKLEGLIDVLCGTVKNKYSRTGDNRVRANNGVIMIVDLEIIGWLVKDLLET